jgi:hypothetical protein
LIRIFGFLFWRSLVNRAKRRVARLREPRYLVPSLLGLGWIVYWGSRAFRHGGPGVFFTGGAMDDVIRQGIAFLGSVFLFVWTALLWLVPSQRAALEFSQPEIHFLFTAPVTRRQIVHYKLLKAQFGILFGALVTAFLWGARLATFEGWARLAGFWLLYALLHLHALGAGFVRTDLIEHGVSGLRRRLVPLALVLVFVAGLAIGLRDAWPALVAGWQGMFAGNDGDLTTAGVRGFLTVLTRLGTTGVLGFMLWPFSVMPHAVMARDAAAFAAWFAAGIALLVLHYVWVVRSDTAFEEASVEAAQRRASRIQRRRESIARGGVPLRAARPFPWKLSSSGRPEIALAWKNLIGMTRVVPVRALIAMSSILIAMIAWTVGLNDSGGTMGVIIGLLLAQLAVFFAMLGPLFVRNDLREDVFRLDALKTIPIPGHAVVWGEILAPTAVLATLELAALGIGLGTLVASGARDLGPMPQPWWIATGVAAMLVLPALTLASVALQNALVLMFPAWVSVGNSRARGFEASGQRLLTLFGTFVFLAFVALPAAIAGGILSWLLAGPWGAFALVPGALLCAGWIVVEIALGCRALGKLYDKLDPSTAGIEPREEGI